MVIGASAASAQEFRLNWGHYLSNGPFLEVEGEFIEAVEERTDGRVEFNVVYSGGLGAGDELLTLAGRGAVDMASVVPGYYPNQLLFAKALQIPHVFDSPAEAIEVAEYSYDNIPAFKEELDQSRVRRLFHQPLGSYYLAGPSEDCQTLGGLEGKKVRTFGSDIPKMMNAIGAVPQSVPAGDQYEALERGIRTRPEPLRSGVVVCRTHGCHGGACLAASSRGHPDHHRGRSRKSSTALRRMG
jgi:TRAP-type C4-dicarboxylate transport system substrate-binding protein